MQIIALHAFLLAEHRFIFSKHLLFFFFSLFYFLLLLALNRLISKLPTIILHILKKLAIIQIQCCASVMQKWLGAVFPVLKVDSLQEPSTLLCLCSLSIDGKLSGEHVTFFNFILLARIANI